MDSNSTPIQAMPLLLMSHKCWLSLKFLIVLRSEVPVLPKGGGCDLGWWGDVRGDDINALGIQSDDEADRVGPEL